MDVMGNFRGKRVYKCNSLKEYLDDVSNYANLLNEEAYCLVEDKLLSGYKQVGTVDNKGVVDIWSRAFSLKSNVHKGEKLSDIAKLSEVAKVVNLNALDNEDIDLVNIDDIIGEIRKLEITFEEIEF